MSFMFEEIGEDCKDEGKICAAFWEAERKFSELLRQCNNWYYNAVVINISMHNSMTL